MPRSCLTAVMMPGLLSGCYRYVPASAGDLSPGSRVRIEVPAARPVSIVTDSGPATYQNVASVRGHVVGLRGDTLVLRETSLVPADDPRGTRALSGQIIYMPDTTARLQRRRLDGTATTFAVLVPIGIIAYFLANLEFKDSGY